MYRIGICDDCREDIETLKQSIISVEPFSKEILIYEYTSGEELLKNIDREHNVVFIDMQMPKMDGLETAFQLRRRNSNVIIVFCSGRMQPTPENFKVRPFSYLMKQLPKKELFIEMGEILGEMERKASVPYLDVHYAGKVIRIRVSHIVYASIYNKTTKLHITKEEARLLKITGEEENDMVEVICNRKLADVKEEIDKYGFEYAHNSYIVNFNFIVRKDKKIIKLATNIELNCSRSREPFFTMRFQEYLTRHKNI